MILNVYVPKEGAIGASHLLKGSGIVAKQEQQVPGRILAYYEGNKFGASNIKTYADKLYHAASRLVTRYPTTAMESFKEDDLVLIGQFDYEAKEFIVKDDEQMGWVTAAALLTLWTRNVS